MKKNLLLALLLAAMTLSCLTACANPMDSLLGGDSEDVIALPDETEDAEETEETGASETAEPAAAEETAAPAEESAPVEFEMTITSVTGSQISSAADSGAVVLGTVGDKKTAETFLIEVTVPVKDFCLWALSSEADEDGNVTITESDCVAAEGVVSAAALITAETGEVLPTAGISYVDPDGNECHCYLEISGESGLPLLVTFEPGVQPVQTEEAAQTEQ